MFYHTAQPVASSWQSCKVTITSLMISYPKDWSFLVDSSCYMPETWHILAIITLCLVIISVLYTHYLNQTTAYGLSAQYDLLTTRFGAETTLTWHCDFPVKPRIHLTMVLNNHNLYILSEFVIASVFIKKQSNLCLISGILWFLSKSSIVHYILFVSQTNNPVVLRFLVWQDAVLPPAVHCLGISSRLRPQLHNNQACNHTA